MNRLAIYIAAFGLYVGCGGVARAQDGKVSLNQTIIPAGAGRIIAGPAANFTGNVTVQILVNPEEPSRNSVALVHFERGARSNWHTHPAGQTLFVEDGCGWTQAEGGPVTQVCKGDTVHVGQGVKHWHGASAASPVTYLTITETYNGRNVDWMRPVDTAEYHAGQKTR